MPELSRTCPDFLLDAAIRLIAEKGYAAMSMRQLATQADLLPGSIYYHVSSKQEILLDAILVIVDRRLHDWAAGAYPRDTTGFLQFLLERQRSHPDEEVLLRHEVRHLDPASQRWASLAQQKLRAPLEQLIIQDRRSEGLSAISTNITIEAVLALIQARQNVLHTSQDETWLDSQSLYMCQLLLGLPTKNDVARTEPRAGGSLTLTPHPN